MDLRSRIDIKVEINTLFVEKELNKLYGKPVNEIDIIILKMMKALQEHKKQLIRN